MRPNLFAGLGMAAITAYFGAGLPLVDDRAGYSGLSPRFLPTLVTLGLAIVTVLLLVRRHSVLEQAEDAAGAIELGRGPQRLALVAGGLLLHLALIGTIGFVLASTLLMVLVARGFGSDRPARDAVVALCVALPIWAVFTQLLGISLALLPFAGF